MEVPQEEPRGMAAAQIAERLGLRAKSVPNRIKHHSDWETRQLERVRLRSGVTYGLDVSLSSARECGGHDCNAKEYDPPMTEHEIRRRLERIYFAFGEHSNLPPERYKPELIEVEGGLAFEICYDNRSEVELEFVVNAIINEICGLLDRTRRRFTAKGRQAGEVSNYVRLSLPMALVIDLWNTDKHEELTHRPYSSFKPKLNNLSSGVILQYDPETRMYASEGTIVSPAFDLEEMIIHGHGSSTNSVVSIVGKVVDENGVEIYDLEKLLPDAIFEWEKFLKANGLFDVQ